MMSHDALMAGVVCYQVPANDRGRFACGQTNDRRPHVGLLETWGMEFAGTNPAGEAPYRRLGTQCLKLGDGLQVHSSRRFVKSGEMFDRCFLACLMPLGFDFLRLCNAYAILKLS